VTALAALDPEARLAALADPGSLAVDPPAGASPDLARFGIVAHADDGIVSGRATIDGRAVLAAAQDERFLRGAVGAIHGRALSALAAHARAERPAAVILVLASGGVRLHVANAAELALARALRAIVDLRASGVPVVAIAAGDVFGGASVLACACDRLALLPHVRFGVSGPAVIETARGRGEIAADDANAVARVFGARARAMSGMADLVDDDAATLRAWIALAVRDAAPFERRVREMQDRLAAHVTRPRAQPPWVERDGANATVRAVRGAFGVAEAVGIDAALLDALDAGGVATVRLVEDSSGHEPTRDAEVAGLAQALAHHACVIGLLRARGVRVEALLAGTGHSAAFFANGLQADRVEALPNARVVAMEPQAMARVLRLDPSRLAALVEDDPLLGHPVRHFAALGGAVIVGAGDGR
jgi:malonate decarboxylase beta subunit